MLFCKRISTPDNLEALLRMVDCDIRTGEVRCKAVETLLGLTHVGSVWALKMNDGSYFASLLGELLFQVSRRRGEPEQTDSP
jgi:hypothetical protein